MILKEGATLFNDKPGLGVDFLVKSGVMEKVPGPEELARFLRNGIGVGLDKTVLGAYLGELGKSNATNTTKTAKFKEVRRGG